MKKYNLQRLVLIPLSLTFLVLISAFVFTSYHISQRDEAAFMESRYRQFRTIFAGLAARDAQAMLTAAEFIAVQQRFHNALQANDLEQLQVHAHEVFLRLQRSLQISHFYFRDSEGNVLLRVYRPHDKSPGNMRASLQRAIETGLPVAGLELGKSGLLAQRLFYPWFVDGKPFGYIELGIDIMPTLRQIKELSDVDIMVILDKESLDQEAWITAHAHHEHYKDWHLLPDSVICETTLNLSREEFVHIFNTAIGKNSERMENIDGQYLRLIGDLVLKIIAQRLTTSVRDQDVIGRFGGEEFLIILPNSSLKTTELLAERCRKVVSETPISCQGVEIPVTASIGISCFSVDRGETAFLQALDAADKALYRAKENGRNQTRSQSYTTEPVTFQQGNELRSCP